MRGTRSTITLLAILALCTPGPATAQPAEPTLTISGTSVAEGAAILPFGVYLSEPSATVVTFDYVTVDETATAGADYAPRSGEYKIDPGFSIGPLPVDILDDTFDEPDERFMLVISNVNGAVFDGAASDPYGVILDDDAPPPTPAPAPPVDTTPPSVTPPRADFARGARLGSRARAVPLLVTFGASDPSGIGATRLQHRIGSRALVEVPFPAPGARSAIVRVSQSRRLVHRFRSRASDGAGNTSAWAPASAFRVTVLQDGSRAVKQKGPWRARRAAAYSGGTARMTTRRGARQRLTAVGTDFAIVSTKGPSQGRAAVLLDGKRVATIDLYARRPQTRTIVYAVSFPTAGRHTIALQATGTKSRPSKGKRVDLDAFLVLKRP